MKVVKHRASLKIKLVVLRGRSEQPACSEALECGYRGVEGSCCVCALSRQSRPGRERRFPGKFGEAGGSRRGGKGTLLCQRTAISPLRLALEKADKASKS